MPGAVLAVHVALGRAVEAGDPLVTLEAMKMEHVVVAPGRGDGSRGRRFGRPTRSVAGSSLAILE